MSRLPILLLAAGKSRRFGEQDKRFVEMPWGGSLLKALLRRVDKAGLHPIVVLDAEDDVSSLFSADCFLSPRAGMGMAYSIADAFAYLLDHQHASSCLVMPVDLPLLRISSLKAVAAAAVENCIVVPECDGRRGHPVSFGRQFWPSLAALEGDGGARSVIDANREAVTAVVVIDEGIYLDADTPENMNELLLRLTRDQKLL